MAEIRADTRYMLTNALIGFQNGLATTSANDSVIIVPSAAHSGQQWYFVGTSTTGYYRMHTEQKGDYAALDVKRWTDALELHMYSMQNNTGQLWRANKQDDGSFRLNNQFTGSDLYLDVVKDTLQPTLAARDGPGQRWTLSQVQSSPTASNTATLSMVSGTVTPTTDSTLGTNTSAASPDGSSSGLSKGTIVGIAVGGASAIALIAGGILLWMRRRNRGGRNAGQHPVGVNNARGVYRVTEES